MESAGICRDVAGGVKNVCGNSWNTLYSRFESRKGGLAARMSPPPEPVGQRLRQVRLDARMTQVEWSERLNGVARALLGADAPRYRQGLVTKLETGMQAPSFDDIAVYATADPKRRGKLWLVWAETVDATLRPAGDARFTTGEMAPVEIDYGEDAHEAAQRAGETKPAAPRKGGRIGNGG